VLRNFGGFLNDRKKNNSMNLDATTAKVNELAGNADALGSTIKFVFNDAEGVVYLDGSGENNTVSNEDKEAECTIHVNHDDLDGMMNGSLNPMGAFMEGKLKIDGDMGAAMKLSAMFS
jgi:acyl-CoA dehydrogenase